MSSDFAAIQNNYAQNFPTQVPIKAAQGFIATAMINLFVGRAVNMALTGGVLAVIATLIEAVTRPIIKGIFPNNPFIASFIQVVVPQVLALSLGTALAPWIGVAYTISSALPSLLVWIALNEGAYTKNTGMAAVF